MNPAAIVDYGAGNLFSLKNALDYIGLPSRITRDARQIENASGVFLPGVGAFPDAMEKLCGSGLIPALKAAAGTRPFMGICLGMQILFETSEEFGSTPGLGLLTGGIVRLRPGEIPIAYGLPEAGTERRSLRTERLKIPHMGWSDLILDRECPLTAGLPARPFVYFVHSYKAKPAPECLIAHTDYGQTVPGIVGRGQLFGCQFHPEKSGEAGLEILRNFKALCQ